jgi:hypothetical protein
MACGGRIRLRSIILSARAKMLAWARTYGQFRGSALPGQDGVDTPGEGSVGVAGGEGEVGPGWEWGHEILGMWNGSLELLSEEFHHMQQG